MTQLYLLPLPNSTASNASGRVGSNVSQFGILEDSGTSVENVSTANVDLRLRGRFQYGPTVSKKLADELDSLSKSPYTALPFFDESGGPLRRKEGYYEIESANVEPAHQITKDVFVYELGLVETGTRENTLIKLTTTPTETETDFTTDGGDETIGVPATANNVRWYTEADGATDATPDLNLGTEFIGVDLYPISDAPTEAASLIYDMPLEDAGKGDVRILDDNNRSKFADTAAGGQVNAWTHVYDNGYEYTGAPVIDNGEIRVFLDTDSGLQTSYWSGDGWIEHSLPTVDSTLTDFDFRRVTPNDARVILSFDDGAGNTRKAILSVQRGRRAILRQPADDVISQDIYDLFDPASAPYDRDLKPVRETIQRNKV